MTGDPDFQFRDLDGPSFDDADEAAVIDDDEEQKTYAEPKQRPPEVGANQHAEQPPIVDISEADIYSPDDPLVAPPAPKAEWRQPRVWLLIVGLLVVIAVILLILSSLSSSGGSDAAQPVSKPAGKARQHKSKKPAKGHKSKKKKTQKGSKAKNYDPNGVILLPPEKKKNPDDAKKTSHTPTVVVP